MDACGRKGLFPSVTFFFLVLGCSLVSGAEARPSGKPIIVQMDLGGGGSDLYALAYAVRSPRLNVVGVIGPDSEVEIRSIRKLLDLMGREDIPVASDPSIQPPETRLGVWVETSQKKRSPSGDAGHLFSKVLHRHKGELRYLILGSQAFEAAKAILSAGTEESQGVRRMVLSDSAALSEHTGTALKRSDLIGSDIGSAVPVSVADWTSAQRVILSRDQVIALGRRRTNLTDELTFLLAHCSPDSGKEKIAVPHVLAVAYLVGRHSVRTHRLSPRKPSASGGAAAFLTVFSASDGADITQDTIHVFKNIQRDLSLGLTRFLFSLGGLDSETRRILQEKRKAETGKESGDSGSDARNEMRNRMLVFLEKEIRVFRSLETSDVDPVLDRLMDTYLEAAGIGWWFPDTFYAKWGISVAAGEPVRFEFGLSNSTERVLSGVEGTFQVGDLRVSQKVDSSTGEVRFRFETPTLPKEEPFPSKATLLLKFDVLGVSLTRTRRVPLLVKQDSE